MPAEIGVIMGQHNYFDDITRLSLQSLFSTLETDIDFLFVDNGSDDGSFEKFREEWPDLPFTRNEKNERLAVFMNEAVKKMRNTWVSLTCNDFLWEKDIYPFLLEAAEAHPQVKVWSPRLFHMHETMGETYCFVKERMNLQVVDDRSQVIRICSGLEYVSPLLVHRETFIELGGYDEDLIYGYEEVDYAFRLYQHNYFTGCRSDVTLFHYGTGFTRKRVFGGRLNELIWRNRMWMKKKWGHLVTDAFGPDALEEW